MKLTGTHTAETAPQARSRRRGHELGGSLSSKMIGLPRRTATQLKGDSTAQPGAPLHTYIGNHSQDRLSPLFVAQNVSRLLNRRTTFLGNALQGGPDATEFVFVNEASRPHPTNKTPGLLQVRQIGMVRGMGSQPAGVYRPSQFSVCGAAQTAARVPCSTNWILAGRGMLCLKIYF
jgi:hypothetical protein